jgi:hypothetical protein
VTGFMHVDAETGAQLVAVVVGAFLATLGGYFASRIEEGFRRKDREKTAALLFGEIVFALKLILELAERARGRGDPWGPVTLRLVRAARHEAATYDRNREALFDIADAASRARTHTMLVQLTMALDGILAADEELRANDRALAADSLSAAERELLERRQQLCGQDRETSFQFALELAAGIPGLLDRLRQTARYSFGKHEELVRGGLQGPG